MEMKRDMERDMADKLKGKGREIERMMRVFHVLTRSYIKV